MSFGNKPTEIDLATKGSTIIIGNNEDVGEQGESRNGVGKSSAIQALIYALYGKGIDKQIKQDDFINVVNKKDMVVILDFEVKGVEYRIIRGRKPNRVELYQGETSLTRDSMKNTDELIQETVGIPYEIFIGTFFMSPHKESFMSMGSAEQRSFIENILSLDVLAKRAESLKLLRKEIQVDAKLAQQEAEHVVSRNTSTETRIDRLTLRSEEWEAETLAEIENNENLLSDLREVDIESEKKLHERAEALRVDVSITKKKMDEVSTDIKIIRPEVDRLKVEVSKYIEAVNGVGAEKEEFDKKLSDLTKQLEELDTTLGEIDEDLEELESIKSDLESEKYKILSSEKEMNADISEMVRTVEALKRENADVEEQIVSLNAGTCPYCKQKHTDEEKIKSLSELIVKNSNEIEVHEDAISCLGKELSELTTVRLPELTEDLKNVETLISDNQSLKKKMIEIDRQISDLKSQGKTKHELVIEMYEGRDIESELRQAESDLSELEAEYDTLKKESETIHEKLGSMLEESIFESSGEIDEAVKEIKRTEEALEKLRSKANPFVTEIEEARSEIIDPTEVEEKLKEINKKETHIGYLIKLLTDSKSFVRKRIVDQYIPFVNKKLLEYTQKVGLSHIAQIMSDLSVEIDYNGRSLSYYNMSQGERMRLNTATTLAFRDLMGMLGKNCNWIGLDEVLDSALDRSGLQKVFKLFMDKSETVWLISHREEFADLVDRKMVVTKSNMFSTIEISQGL